MLSLKPRVRARAALLSAVVARVGASGEAIERLLGGSDPRLQPEEQQALWRYRARGSDPLAVFVSLFVLGQPAEVRSVRAAFAEHSDGLQGAGLLLPEVAGGRQSSARGLLRAALSLSVHDGRLLWSDADSTQPGREHVLGVTRATLVLERALPRHQPLRHVLEIGTGSGYLALGLAANAATVTATDVSARALELAALNAALGGVANLTLLRSDRFAALGRRRFDFIAGNLPFVIAPSPRYTFRDSGIAEDGFVASVVAGAGKHLRPGAFALFIGQWVHREGEAEDQRLAPWFVAAGCDALVIRLEAEPVDTYAARWSAGPAISLPQEDRDRLLEHWVHNLRRARIQGVSTGLFVLRRRVGKRHFMSIDDGEVSPPVRGSASPTWADIGARFAVLDGEAGLA